MGNLPSTLLASDMGVLTGMATVVNIRGNFYNFNVSKSANEADQVALAHDCRQLAYDFRAAIAAIEPKVEVACPAEKK